MLTGDEQDFLESLVNDVIRIVAFEEELFHFKCFFLKVRLLRTESAESQELRVGYAGFSTGMMRRSVVEIRV